MYSPKSLPLKMKLDALVSLTIVAILSVAEIMRRVCLSFSACFYVASYLPGVYELLIQFLDVSQNELVNGLLLNVCVLERKRSAKLPIPPSC